jgi:glycine/D-amino acid oxidase-like deaminating enzyme
VRCCVLAINGWTPVLLPDLATRIQNTEQPLWYFTLPAETEAAFQPGRFPVFLFANAQVYGLPLHRGSVKIACDAPARLLDRPEHRRLTPDAYRAELHAFLVRQLPALESATLMQERVCFYDRSPDGDFILDQWDPHARLLVACGFSGHGFKFGPLTGARLAQYALTGRPATDLAPFSLKRFEPLPAGAGV